MISRELDADKFTKAVEVVKALLDEGKAYVVESSAGMFFPWVGVTIRVLDDKALDSLLTKKGLSREEFKGPLGSEISRMMRECLGNRQVAYTEECVQRWRKEKHEEPSIEAEKAELVQKLKRITELIDNRLRESWEFKRHSKTAFLSQLDWDIRVKYLDSEVDVRPVTVATCQFVCGGVPGRTPESCDSFQVSCTENDISYLIDVLTLVREKMRNVRKEGGVQ